MPANGGLHRLRFQRFGLSQVLDNYHHHWEDLLYQYS